MDRMPLPPSVLRTHTHTDVAPAYAHAVESVLVAHITPRKREGSRERRKRRRRKKRRRTAWKTAVERGRKKARGGAGESSEVEKKTKK